MTLTRNHLLPLSDSLLGQDVVQLVASLPSAHETPGLIFSPAETGIMAQAYDSRAVEVEAG